MYPASISLCNSCGDLMEYMNNGDEESFNKIHQITDNKDDDLLKEFIKTWDDKYNKNKKAGDVRRKSKLIEDASTNDYETAKMGSSGKYSIMPPTSLIVSIIT